ncbi:V-type ATP synthase subunit D [Meiothermus taiwanensis]|jgi:V/A-type H+-transporting ATPase subunit D|uniref:V-type ATP synthase subunit D n=2 Tax=Meiothermus taiwanensis TaxID=172827 RepID=A0A399E7K9_9DEIN|nr:V-type ATP synthase subunit D [Meiothermus taiwanensis]AWR85959.1 V-type H+-transporting ATPase subunit D [Meiothermus taiwanensis WR-220]KIQ53572.1 ATP synthase subunit D [Meiothermus taiwanensis]KZK15465.1 V-type ATP synthase subunit D [Meiothermus taiwanensis]RIH79503.1 V-type ATP synthase subunit D [Meiothermus taiwanensis]
MAEQVSPTRSTLLAKRDQKRLALQGVELLKNKRDALIGEFFALVQDSLKAREALNNAAKEAYFSLLIAKAFDTPEAVESLSSTPLEVRMEVESLYGVKVPRISAPEAGAGLSFSPIGVGAKTLEAATAFRRLAEAIVAVANTENRLRKIGEEIKKTNRRVNALEQISIPEINEQIKFITDTLDQRALEEVTTLKRIKAAILAREAEEQGIVSAHIEKGAGL